ncbi:MAG: hypothetical protein LBE30_17370 [Comamonas sp.]|jgi:hypothetical protein|nr:hypothetical protein [Comamonas sp.]
MWERYRQPDANDRYRVKSYQRLSALRYSLISSKFWLAQPETKQNGLLHQEQAVFWLDSISKSSDYFVSFARRAAALSLLRLRVLE